MCYCILIKNSVTYELASLSVLVTISWQDILARPLILYLKKAGVIKGHCSGDFSIC